MHHVLARYPTSRWMRVIKCLYVLQLLIAFSLLVKALSSAEAVYIHKQIAITISSKNMFHAVHE